MNYTIQDKFDVSAQRYWEVFFSEDFNEALWAHLDIDREVIRMDRKGEGDDLVIHREQRLTPRREVPRALKKFVKGGMTYVETNEFRARDNRMDAKTTPGFLADKLVAKGIYRLEVLGPEQVNRIWDAECTCKVMLVGGTIEKFIVDEVKDSYRKTTEFTRRWFAEHPA